MLPDFLLLFCFCCRSNGKAGPPGSRKCECVCVEYVYGVCVCVCVCAEYVYGFTWVSVQSVSLCVSLYMCINNFLINPF